MKIHKPWSCESCLNDGRGTQCLRPEACDLYREAQFVEADLRKDEWAIRPKKTTREHY